MGTLLVVRKRADPLPQDLAAGAVDSRVSIGVLLRKTIALDGQAGSAKLRDAAAGELRGQGPDDEVSEFRKIGAPLSIDGSKGRRLVAMSLWAIPFVTMLLLVGLPTDPFYVFAWLWATVIAWNSHQPWRVHLRFARDWLPAVGVLGLYTLSRGYADNGAVPHVREMVTADIRLWGWTTGGVPPTVWLQQHLFDPVANHWWDVLVSFVYFSHFVVTPTIAMVLWLRARPRWAAYMRRWLALSVAGLATYVAYPAAPPWWAAEHGQISAIGRVSTRGWDAIGLHGAGNVLNAAQLDASNPIAAMPSLHSAFALLAVVFLARAVRRRWWPLLAAYPVAMTFTLVYSGEHWVIDVLVGWAYVAGVLLVLAGAERWRRSWIRSAEEVGRIAVHDQPRVLVGGTADVSPPASSIATAPSRRDPEA